MEARLKESLHRQFFNAFRAKDFNGALRTTDFMPLDPADPTTLYLRGICLFELGRYDEALASFGHVVRIEPNFRDVQYRLGCCVMAGGRVRAFP
jgi:Flp pilus assembly protein TadD